MQPNNIRSFSRQAAKSVPALPLMALVLPSSALSSRLTSAMVATEIFLIELLSNHENDRLFNW